MGNKYNGVLTVRGVPNTVHEEIKQLALENNRKVNAQIVHMLKKGVEDEEKLNTKNK